MERNCKSVSIVLFDLDIHFRIFWALLNFAQNYLDILILNIQNFSVLSLVKQIKFLASDWLDTGSIPGGLKSHTFLFYFLHANCIIL